MMYYTHLAFGLFSSFIFLKFFEIRHSALFILVVLLFSVFPDIDEPKSKIGRKNKFFSSIIGFIFGHRGFLHTIYIPFILLLIFYSISKEIGIGIFIGYFSHLLMDSLTRHGIKPFFPIINKRIYGFIRVNSIFEKLFFLAICFLDIYLALNYIL